jgi:Icc-related predicted phosphoesterase
MKFLAISDEVVSWIYSQTLRERCSDVDFVLSCGDLPEHYLEFVASTINKPCYYVCGNHDVHGEVPKTKDAPAGWINLDMRVERLRGHSFTMAGLEGCLQYQPGSLCQYTQRAQWLRAAALGARMLFSPPDIFVAHAPPFGVHNGPDHAHTGFKALNWVMETFRPKLLLHGHQHRNYDPTQQGETQYGETLVVNVHPYRILEL